MIDIAVVPVFEGKRISRIQIVNITIVPFTSCSAEIYLFDENNQFVRTEKHTMTQQEYLDWMNDDTYLIEFILRKSGFQQQSDVSITP